MKRYIVFPALVVSVLLSGCAGMSGAYTFTDIDSLVEEASWSSTEVLWNAYEDIESAPTFAQIAGRVAELIQGRIIIAHNAKFDIAFLENSFESVGTKVELANACTMQGARSAGIYPTKLQNVADHYGLSNGGAHEAIHDTILVAEIWKHFLTQMDFASVRALAAAEHTLKSPWPATEVVDGFHREHARALV